MPESVNWTIQVQIQGGKTLHMSGQEKADGFDKMSPTIPASKDGKTASTLSVPIDAGAKLLLVSTDDKSGNLTVAFTSSDGKKVSQPVPLTQGAPLFLIGPQLVGNQVDGGAEKPTGLAFGNTNQQDVAVGIFMLSDLPQPD